MNYVQPIRDPEMIKKIKRYLRDKNERDYMLFVTGINAGLRISDILKLRVSDVGGDRIIIKEGKTGKRTRYSLTSQLQRAFKAYTQGKRAGEYLFRSRQGDNQPIGRRMAHKILREAADHFNLPDIGTHSMRKTFGYHLYKQTHDVVLLQEIFNHSTPETTLRYIGINQDSIDKAISKFKI